MSHRALQSLACLTAVAAAAQSSAPVMQHVGDKAWTSHFENVLGTSLELTVRSAGRASAERAEAAVLASIAADNRTLSAWDNQSELSRWMRTRGEAVQVSRELFDVLSQFESWRAQTGGALDASAETAARLWQSAAAEGHVPTVAEMAQAKLAMQQEHWLLDAEHRTATHLTDAPLALASFTKSYIANRAAEAALAHGAAGVMLNVGGDIVTRGALSQIVDIANPDADAENDAVLDQVLVRDRAVATSGGYRRGAHIFDPRTAQPVCHIASATVIARDAATAGALATAFCVLSSAETEQLAAKHAGTAYLLVLPDGQHVASAKWREYQTGSVVAAAYVATPHAGKPAASADWNQSYEVVIGLELPRIEKSSYRRPYVAVWVEDKDKFPLRTVALWYDNRQRWLPELKSWYRDDQMRNLAEGTDITKTISSATRGPGKYTLKWDGKDNEGKPVKAGTYTLCVEIAREHGGHEVMRKEITFTGQPQQVEMGKTEEGSASLDYRKR